MQGHGGCTRNKVNRRGCRRGRVVWRVGCPLILARGCDWLVRVSLQPGKGSKIRYLGTSRNCAQPLDKEVVWLGAPLWEPSGAENSWLGHSRPLNFTRCQGST